jgi:hypothetical protein
VKRLRIGFIGNFRVPYTTENDRKWSFEKLGHEVIPFQENQTSALDLTAAMHRLDMLVYSHTHGWEIAGLRNVFEKYKEAGIPTVSVHLDRWAWLERERDVGKEATWFTEYLFMADFSPEAQLLYKQHGLQKVYYLKPGVVERDCYMATPDNTKYPHEIVFVGSKGYHHEYAFRPKLIEWLQATYGPRFGHYGNDGIGVVRGHDLNVLYATAKVAVGDSCFGGRPNYVSDRYYETRGRGGFLINPRIEGVDNYGVGIYEAENLLDLEQAINGALENSDVRESQRMVGFNHVKRFETYTNRAQEMLETIFGGLL